MTECCPNVPGENQDRMSYVSMNRTQITAVLMLTARFALRIGLSGYLSLRFYERSLQAQFPVEPFVQGNRAARTVFIGDSRVAQWAEHDRLDGLYVGFPGATASQITAAARVFNWPTDIGTIVIQAGVNDMRILGMRPELRDSRVAATHGDLVALVEACLKHTREVILLRVLPVGDPQLIRMIVWSNASADGVAQLN